MNQMRYKNNNIKYRKNKITKKFVIAVIPIIILFMFFSSTLGTENKVKKEIIVNSRDTLWSISKKISKGNNISIHEVIYDIKKLNSISDYIIYEGQVLTVYEY